MAIYLDNAATTKVSDVAVEKMIFMSKTNFANPSSVHSLGLLAEKEITKVRKTIASFLNAKEDEIYFTSGATEANNLAIIGSALANKRSGNHIITQKTEHASVIESVSYLEKIGYEITYLENDNTGQIDYDVLEKSITDNTILVSLMHVNNETGAKLDIERIGKIVKSKNKNTLFHTDLVQSFCKFDIDVLKYNIDLCSFSGHKLHSPKGVGGIFIKKGVKIESRQFGGSQEKKIRPGTENILGITALGESILYINKNMSKTLEYVKSLKNCLIQIKDLIDDVYVTSDDSCSPYVVNLSFIGVKGEVLVHALEQYDIYCSTGSACHKGSGSEILKNYNLSEDIYSSGIRVSFCDENTVDEIEKLKTALLEIVPKLRRFKKR